MHINDLLWIQYKGRQFNKYKLCGKSQKKQAKYIWDITNITNKDYEETSQDSKKKKGVVKNAINPATMLHDVQIN